MRPRLDGEGQIARGTIALLRQDLRAMVAWAPPPAGATRDDLRGNLRRAQRLAGERRGLGYRARAGRPSRRRPAPVPTPVEIAALVAATRGLPRKLSKTAADLAGFLYVSGMRVGAALVLSVGDLRLMPDGRRYAIVTEKSRPDRRPVLIRGPRFERLADEPPGTSLWSEGARRLSINVFRARLYAGCGIAGLGRIRPHDLRRAFATHVADRLGLEAAGLAGGWIGLQVVADYVSPRLDS